MAADMNALSSPSLTNLTIADASEQYSNFFRQMEQMEDGMSMRHQRSMIEVPQAILNLKYEFPDHNPGLLEDEEDYVEPEWGEERKTDASSKLRTESNCSDASDLYPYTYNGNTAAPTMPSFNESSAQTPTKAGGTDAAITAALNSGQPPALDLPRKASHESMFSRDASGLADVSGMVRNSADNPSRLTHRMMSPKSGKPKISLTIAMDEKSDGPLFRVGTERGAFSPVSPTPDDDDLFAEPSQFDRIDQIKKQARLERRASRSRKGGDALHWRTIQNSSRSALTLSNKRSHSNKRDKHNIQQSTGVTIHTVADIMGYKRKKLHHVRKISVTMVSLDGHETVYDENGVPLQRSSLAPHPILPQQYSMSERSLPRMGSNDDDHIITPAPSLRPKRSTSGKIEIGLTSVDEDREDENQPNPNAAVIANLSPLSPPNLHDAEANVDGMTPAIGSGGDDDDDAGGDKVTAAITDTDGTVVVTTPDAAEEAIIADEELYDDEDDYEDDDEDGTEKEESLPLEMDEELWLEPIDGEFEECDICFEDDFLSGAKPAAGSFRTLHYFFKFIYDRFHNSSTFLLDTKLPPYHEWKRGRRVKGFRPQAIRNIDHSLRAYIQVVDTMKAMVKNTLLLCWDDGQAISQMFQGSARPPIDSHNFKVGKISIMSTQDLFSVGLTPTADDWRRALNHSSPGQFLAKCAPDFRYMDDSKKREQNTHFHMYRRYQFYCLAEHIYKHHKQLGFGSTMEWKKIKTQFLSHNNAVVINAFDYLTYYLNPKVDDIANLMADRNANFFSNRRIVAEPMLWLIYISRFLLDRQAKLYAIIASCGGFGAAAGKDSRFKGQKIEGLIADLAKDAKEESELLQKIVAKLPSIDDLKQTFAKEIQERDANNESLYTRSFDMKFLDSTKDNLSTVNRGKK